MRSIYILIMLVVAALALGCVGNKQDQTSTQAPSSPGQVSPIENPASVDSASSGAATQSDVFGTENELVSVDSLVNDSNADISLSDSI